jgi:hypothetical protein
MLYGKCICSQSETTGFQNFLAEHAPRSPPPFFASVNLPQDQTPDVIWISSVIFLKVLLRFSVHCHWNFFFCENIAWHSVWQLVSIIQLQCPSIDLLIYHRKFFIALWRSQKVKYFFHPWRGSRGGNTET